MLTPLGRSFLNTFWSENLSEEFLPVVVAVVTGRWWGERLVGYTTGRESESEKEGEREREMGWKWLQQVAVSGGGGVDVGGK
ncbi:hypothetical protein Hanom_Chr04g00372051 [Helianthus anomalus]